MDLGAVMSERFDSGARRRERLRPSGRPSATGTANFVRAYRIPLCCALYAATITTTAVVTSILASRGSPRLQLPKTDCTGRLEVFQEQLSKKVAVSLVEQWGDAGEDGKAMLQRAARAMPAAVGKLFNEATSAATDTPQPARATTPPGAPWLGGSSTGVNKQARPIPPAPQTVRGEPRQSPASEPSSPDKQTAQQHGVWGDDAPIPAEDDEEIAGDSRTLTAAAADSELPLSPGIGKAGLVSPAPRSADAARALLVICYNRPDYLRRTLTTVLERLPVYDRPHVFVSQDGHLSDVAAVVAEMQTLFSQRAPDIPFSHIQHEQHIQSGDDGNGYMRLARHFGWALGQVFDRGHPRVIILEDDLEIAPDFFEYFSAVAPLVESDPTILAASAYNDIGQSEFVSDEKQVLRSDFFPGLGWLMTADAWAELGPKWPDGYWDDWLREPAQAKGRAFLHPEVSRTKTFGQHGVSQSQFFDRFLGTIRLATTPVDWKQVSLEYLRKEAYDTQLEREVRNAHTVSAAEAMTRTCASLRGAQGDAVKVAYGDVARYEMTAKVFGFIADVKAGVPRTAYKGIVSFRHNQCRVYLVPR